MMNELLRHCNVFQRLKADNEGQKVVENLLSKLHLTLKQACLPVNEAAAQNFVPQARFGMGLAESS